MKKMLRFGDAKYGTDLRPLTQVMVAVVAAGLLAGCKTARVTGEQELAPVTASKPAIIYVSDFQLSAQEIQHEEGLLGNRPGPVGRVEQRLSGAPQNPEARARQLVDLMANSIVQDLTKAGFTATRLATGAPLPTRGWLVRGVVTEVQEGNRLERSMVGMGRGQTDLQVLATVDDLSKGTPKPLYELATEASSGKGPGAAPTLAFGPYGAAARFVMSRNDLEKNVKQTAAAIAERVTKRVGAGP